MKSLSVKEISRLPADGRAVEARAWVRTKRETKAAIFLEVNDGSRLANLQCVFDEAAAAACAAELARAGTGASVAVTGTLVPSPAAGQAVELRASGLRVIGEAPADSYPLQKKAHSMEFLREIAHLRPRTNTFGAVARVRNRMAFAIHQFFQERGFQYVHTPLITASDCEGAGAMFQVTTLDLARVGASGQGPDYSKDFFGKPAFLTVSGQLDVETYCEALTRVYTFGPTFRAENSNTSRHLSEFWMIEPEVAFNELTDNMELAEDFIKQLVRVALSDCAEDLAFFDQRVEKGLVASLEAVLGKPFAHMTYTEAMKILERDAATFEVKPYWGIDLMSEHEKYLCEKIAGGPLFLTDYPKEIKSFYMKRNDDGKTVRAMDLLVPRFGEIIGGSEREDRLDVLTELMREKGMKESDYWWYLDLRRFGTTPHSGFGLGFERLIMYVTGVPNIRDVIPFPRAPKLADF